MMGIAPVALDAGPARNNTDFGRSRLSCSAVIESKDFFDSSSDAAPGESESDLDSGRCKIAVAGAGRTEDDAPFFGLRDCR
jgi:hypothetical protein